MRRITLVLIAGLLVATLPAVGATADNGFAPECLDAVEDPDLAVGVVDCIRVPSEALGATTAFAYYIPPACDPALGRECPVFYFLHGTGGSYNNTPGLGRVGNPDSDWVRALTHGPPEDPYEADEPWQYGDPSTWVPQDPIDMIIVHPHGQTVPGGHGPQPAGQNGYWFDWNPRYAQGGDSERYPTPAPRFETFVVDELVPYVDHHFPTGGTRDQRAISGKSMGGIGSLMLGLKHPDVWSSIGSLAGGAIPLPVLTGEDDAVASLLPGGIAPPVDLPYVRPPGVVPSVVPEAVWEEALTSLVTVGFGDLVADHSWWRANQATDHAGNARAFRDGQQSVHLKFHIGDIVPRRLEDFSSTSSIQWEVLLFAPNIYLDHVFGRHGVERDFNIHPGHHGGFYQRPWYRNILEEVAARMRHWDGSGTPLPEPDVFDYRTTATDVDIWGWRFDVDREPVEFLSLRDVSCSALTLQGTGQVTVTVPANCRTGVDGSRTFTVDLGPAQATDEPAGLGTSRTYGRTVSVPLDPLGPCPPRNPRCGQEGN